MPQTKKTARKTDRIVLGPSVSHCYRVVAQTLEGSTEQSYTIHICLHDAYGNITGINFNPESPYGMNSEELRENLLEMLHALSLPVVEFDRVQDIWKEQPPPRRFDDGSQEVVEAYLNFIFRPTPQFID